MSAMGMQKTRVGDGAQARQVDILRFEPHLDELVAIGRPEVKMQRTIRRRLEPLPPPAARRHLRVESPAHVVTDGVAAGPDARAYGGNQFGGVNPELPDASANDLLHNARRSASPAGMCCRDESRRRVCDQDRDAIGRHDGDRDGRRVRHEPITLELAGLHDGHVRTENANRTAVHLPGPNEPVGRQTEELGKRRPGVFHVVPHVEAANRERVRRHVLKGGAPKHGAPRRVGPCEARPRRRQPFTTVLTLGHDVAVVTDHPGPASPGGAL